MLQLPTNVESDLITSSQSMRHSQAMKRDNRKHFLNILRIDKQNYILREYVEHKKCEMESRQGFR